MNQKTKEWLKLLGIVISTGSAVLVASYLSGAKLWIAILCGVGTAASNVLHALGSSPNEQPNVTVTATSASGGTSTIKPD